MALSAKTTISEFVNQIAERETTNPRPCRRFGVEIETPEAGRISADGFSKTHDPSVSDPECECECEECYHSCDCGNCDLSNGYGELDHCGECTANELALDYSKGNRSDAYGVIKDTCQELLAIDSQHQDEYRGHPYGGHIHTEARDLTPLKLALLMRYYRHAQRLFPTEEFFGRDTNDYCSHLSESDIEQTAQGWQIDRMVAVNTQNVLNFRERCENYPDRYNKDTKAKSTVEFRQFASTNDWRLTLARVAFCVALVDYTAQGLPPYWLLRTQTWQDFAKEIKM
jgi:hypothetical protein